MLAHEFFNGIDLDKLFQKKTKAPFLPSTTDPKKMMQKSGQMVLLRDLRESMPNLQINQELFEDFGTDLDQTAKDELIEAKRRSDEMKQRGISRSLDDSQEETKPLPTNTAGQDHKH